jgi:hypothetical protein
MSAPRAQLRGFVYRGGVRVAGTVVACDAIAGGDLTFLSHAPAAGAAARRALPRLTARRQLLATETTLALLGSPGNRLRPHALIAGYGRPFTLGGVRLELFPTDLVPGAAGLVCEHAGRRLVYAGLIGPDADVRAADALCLDVRYARPGITFLSRAAALAAIGLRVRAALAAGAAPLLRVAPDEIALPIARALAADGIGLRAHRNFVQAAAAHRDAGLEAAPVQRFAGRVGDGEVLLWPAGVRPPPQRSGARPLVELRVAPDGAGDDAIAYPAGLDLAGVASYVAATGAREVAVLNAVSDDLVRSLSTPGIVVYPLGPPRQLPLPAAR